MSGESQGDNRFLGPDHSSMTHDESILGALAGMLSISTLPTPKNLVAKAEMDDGARPQGSLELSVRYQTLLEQIPAVVFMAVLDEGRTEAYVSPHIETVLGFKSDEWLDDPVRWYFQIHPDDRGRWNLEAASF